MANDWMKERLKNVPLFRELSDHELESLVSICHVRVYKPRTFVFMQGDPLERVYFIHSGTVKIYKTDMSGKEQIVSILIISSPSYHLSHRGNNAPTLTKRLRNTTMKSIKTFVAVAALSMISFGTFAQSISASASTLDRAEAKIAAQAAEQGASYKITSAQFNNRVHMTAELTK